MALFHADGNEYRDHSVRWVLSAAIKERSAVISRWGIDDNRLPEEVILGLMELYQEAWAYTVVHDIAIDLVDGGS